MSRFADPTALREVDLGPCDCPGAPHVRDWAKIRADLSASEIGVLFSISSADGEVGATAKVAPFIAEWNLLGPDGTPWEPSVATLLLLRAETITPLVEAIIDVARQSRLPNRSGAPSPASPRGSASPTPSTTPTPGT